MHGAVLWDLDGTLIDSEQYHWLAWRDTMAAESVSITYDQFRGTFGLRNDVIIPSWLPGVASGRAEQIAEAKEIAYRSMVARDGIEPLPGVAECVRRLHEQGWLQAVASSAPRENVRVVLEASMLDRCFEACVAAEDVRNGKPDPEVFLTAASRLGVPPARCIVVEDAPAGLEGARRAGMKTIGVAAARVLTGADISVPSLKHLPPNAFEALIAQ